MSSTCKLRVDHHGSSISRLFVWYELLVVFKFSGLHCPQRRTGTLHQTLRGDKRKKMKYLATTYLDVLHNFDN
jgi:hypothetical protein